MTQFASPQKRKLFCLLICVLTAFIFTADIFDLREELQILSCPYTGIDDDITTGMTDRIVFDPSPLPTFSSVLGASSVTIPSSHLPACGFRAPPGLS
ncbi:MAG: hypothetical protein ACYC7J_06325 [Syntrophales bacterium]